MNIQPGHESEVWQHVLPVGAVKQQRTLSPESFVSLGHEDLILPHSSFMPNSSKSQNDLVSLKEVLGRVLGLQWKLVGEPRRNFARVSKRKMLWKALSDPPPEFRRITPLIAATMDVEVLLDNCEVVKSKGRSISISERYERSIASKFKETSTETSVWCLRKLLVSRHMLNSFAQVTALWREKLRDYSDANRMIELADSWITWLNALRVQVANGATSAEIEELIRSFTVPFGQAVVQRFITGFHMSEATDFTAEFKGGLSKVLTGLDGLMKSVLALVGPPSHIGALTLTGYDPRAFIEVKTVSDPTTRAEFTFAVANINSTHLVHPLNIHTVLHEILHTIPNSTEFQAILETLAHGPEIVELLNVDERDDEDGLMRIRIEEIIVEYLLALLVFGESGIRNSNEEDYRYSHSYLLQVAIHPESYSYTPEIKRLFLLDNIARGFVVQKMLRESKNVAAPIDWSSVREDFLAWWGRNQRFVLSDFDDAVELGVLMADKLKNQPDEWAQRIHTIRKAVAMYFGTADPDNPKSSANLRKQFYEALSVSKRPDFATGTSLMFGKPVHIVFSSGPDDPERDLRVRRLESLVAYVRLIAGFYDALEPMLELTPNGLLLLRRSNNELDFRECDPVQRVLVNCTAGALFTLGEEWHHKYCQLRIAFLKSMWQHAEVTKNSEINYLLKEKSLSPSLRSPA
jgi:hypothetical protein